jgi:putative hydrolase of the HAD superfamily
VETGQGALVRAVLFDFGGVITTSPFEAFRRFEQERGLPAGFLQSINRNNPDNNAWAQFERGDIGADVFDEMFAAECRAVGHDVRGLDVVALVFGQVRPKMVEAVRRCRKHFITACLTNNFRRGDIAMTDQAREQQWRDALALFDVVIESSKAGVRKPEKQFFELACAQLSITPDEAVFLDDLGINLKPARAMGMRTIKVSDPDMALDELGAMLGMDLS